ncbi:MAG: hypothetical protein H0T83_07210 [Chthoniobacterales bacterium]|nr:hypothetical protein [Chthoniobacterales bacterium]
MLGVLMLGALFVPLSECSHGGKANDLPPPPKTGLQKIFPRSDAQTEYSYGATRIGLSLHGAAAVVAFGWPLVLALLEQRARGKRHAWLLYTLELLLCAGTIWWIYAVSEGGKRLWGAYFVFALMGLYVVAALIDFWTKGRGGAQRARSA